MPRPVRCRRHGAVNSSHQDDDSAVCVMCTELRATGLIWTRDVCHGYGRGNAQSGASHRRRQQGPFHCTLHISGRSVVDVFRSTVNFQDESRCTAKPAGFRTLTLTSMTSLRLPKKNRYYSSQTGIACCPSFHRKMKERSPTG